MSTLTAVIIKGNPKFVNGNIDAERFYGEIKSFLETLCYDVSFDNGDPYTTPKTANLWIGHSRGVDRLRFAPSGTHILAFGSSHKDAINHPDDNTKTFIGPSDVVPNKFHYEFTEEMKRAILGITKSSSCQ